MLNRFYLAGFFTVALLVSSPTPSQAQVSQEARITLEWRDAALADVLDGFARFSRRTIVVARDVRPSTVTVSVKGMGWRTALDTILEEQGLIAREDAAGVIHVENRPSPQPRSGT